MADVRRPTVADLDAVLVDMRDALLAEFGALAIYGRLSRLRADPELANLLETFQLEEREQIDRLRALLESLGKRAPKRSLRRGIAPWFLACAARCGFRSLALRSCLVSEETVARWYLRQAMYLDGAGLVEAARSCAAFSSTKQRHALALQAWVER